MTSPNPTMIFTFSTLCLVAIVAIFALKYLTAAYRGKRDENHRVAMNSAIDALRQELSSVTKRVNAMEKLLKEVE